jgi:hypothetical protein
MLQYGDAIECFTGVPALFPVAAKERASPTKPCEPFTQQAHGTRGVDQRDAPLLLALSNYADRAAIDAVQRNMEIRMSGGIRRLSVA